MWQYLRGGSTHTAQDASDTSEATSSSTSDTSSYSFSRLSTYVYDKAADVAFDLAPVEHSLSLLRISAVLAELSHLVYVTRNSDVQQQSQVDLPLLGSFSNRATVACKLLHFREASQNQQLQSPQQYGIWEVEGLGLVVAFRGTSTWDDVFVDINVRPMPLTCSGGAMDGTQVHSGFWEGAKQHVEDIKQVVQEQDRQAGRHLPVWITGHSLGGGYANCMMLHLLANKRTADLFSAGGGSVTFGAPMVLYSEDPPQMYKQLHMLERAAEGRGRKRKLQCHNFVNNTDAVPRFLGGSLNAVHQAVESYAPSMKAMRETAQHYLPFGDYHIIHGSHIRTPDPPGSKAADRAEYAKRVCHQLDARQLPKIAWLTGGRTGGLMDHKIIAYRQRIRHHMDQLAMDHPKNHFEQTLQPECENQDPAQLFDMTGDAQQAAPLHTAVLDGVAHQLGAAGKTAISEWAPHLGNAALAAASSQGSAAVAAASSRWTSYWQKPPISTTR